MKKHLRFVLSGLLLVIALFLTSCGSSGSAQQGETESGGDLQGMDMGTAGGTAPRELIVDGEYSDERFIDMMAAHHQMAIDTAKVAQENAELPEKKQIADNIVTTHQAEIEELQSIKERKFGSSEVPPQMKPEEPSMYAMLMPDQLAQLRPFDQAFIDSMIPHHASAIEMASTANLQSGNGEIKDLSRRGIDAQSKEIGQMSYLRQENYPEG